MKNTFFIALLVTLIISFVFPGLGAKLDDAGLPSVICIMAMYFGLGVVTDLRTMKNGLASWKLILFIELSLFAVGPLLGYLFFFVASHFAGRMLSLGIFFLSAVPTTMTSCVMLTKKYKGAYATSLYGAVLSQLIGVVVTPLIISVFLNLGFNFAFSLSSVFISLVYKMLLPFSIGMLFHCFEEKIGKVCSVISFYGIFLMLYMSFSKLIASNDFFSLCCSLAFPLLFTVLFCLCYVLLNVLVSGLLGFKSQERTAAVFTGCQKTLGMGIPLVAVFFPEYPEIAASVSLLIVVYYISALFITVRGVQLIKKESIHE